MHVHIEYVCFMFALSCKRGIIHVQRKSTTPGETKTFWRVVSQLLQPVAADRVTACNRPNKPLFNWTFIRG